MQAAEEAEATGRRRDTELVTMPTDHMRERWDCESVLSLRSNLDNHPGRIAEPNRPPRRTRLQPPSAAAGAPIVLSTKTVRALPGFMVKGFMAKILH